jgi:hypothetical protein
MAAWSNKEWAFAGPSGVQHQMKIQILQCFIRAADDSPVSHYYFDISMRIGSTSRISTQSGLVSGLDSASV